jgi:hypothetical protein
MNRRIGAGLGSIAIVLSLASPASAAPAGGNPPTFGRATLTGFATLPAETFVPASEPSGSLLGTAAINGVIPPFGDQPVQGFSGIVHNGDGTFDVISDNGYGNQANSADFVLRMHRLAPVFRTGRVDVLGGVNLTDADGVVPFPLTRPDRVLGCWACPPGLLRWVRYRNAQVGAVARPLPSVRP